LVRSADISVRVAYAGWAAGGHECPFPVQGAKRESVPGKLLLDERIRFVSRHCSVEDRRHRLDEAVVKSGFQFSGLIAAGKRSLISAA